MRYMLEADHDALLAAKSERDEYVEIMRLLRAEFAEANATTAAALGLVADLRHALGDDGKRMQPELLEYARQLVKDAARWQPIEMAPTDRLPRLYLINGFCVQGFLNAAGYLMVQSEIYPHWRRARGRPTHYMPLPQPPGAPA